MKAQNTDRLGFGMLLVGVARRWRAAVDAHLASQGLSDATWAPLMHVARAGHGLTQKELAASIGIDGSTLVRLIDILAAKGLLERRQAVSDRRVNHLHLTRAGHALVQEIQRSLNQVESALLADLDDAQIRQLTEMLTRIDQRIAGMRDASEPTP